MKQSVSYLALAAVVAVAGCGGGKGSYQAVPKKPIAPASVAAGQEATLFPLKVGNQWVYTATDARRIGNQAGTQTAELTFKVSAVTPVEGGTKGTIQVTLNGKVQETQDWLVNSKGIYQTAGGKNRNVYNPPQPAILFPIKAGQTFQWKGSGLMPDGSNGSGTLDNTLLGAQEVDTDMGRMSAFAVESKGTFKSNNGNGQMSSIVWWAPKVGLVRWRMEVAVPNRLVSQTLKLKSYTLK